MELEHKVELISRRGNEYVWRAVGDERTEVPDRHIPEVRRRERRSPR